MSLKVNIEKYFKPDVYLDDVVRTSSTVGHLKNDGTVDTTSYATSASVSAITDGQSIDSFSDVETDLASKTENSVVGTVENGTTASQAYAVGEHFIRNDKFCTAIATIASGATLTLNTNYVEGTIAEALNRGISRNLLHTYTIAKSDFGSVDSSGRRLAEKLALDLKNDLLSSKTLYFEVYETYYFSFWEKYNICTGSLCFPGYFTSNVKTALAFYCDPSKYYGIALEFNTSQEVSHQNPKFTVRIMDSYYSSSMPSSSNIVINVYEIL